MEMNCAICMLSDLFLDNALVNALWQLVATVKNSKVRGGERVGFWGRLWGGGDFAHITQQFFWTFTIRPLPSSPQTHTSLKTEHTKIVFEIYNSWDGWKRRVESWQGGE